jgi:HEPN domain-containing protein
MYKYFESEMKKARLDFQAASSLFNDERFALSFLFCYRAVLRALKSLFEERHRGFKPQNENLSAIAESLNLELPTPLSRFLLELNLDGIAAGAANESEPTTDNFSAARAYESLQKTEQLLQWVEEQHESPKTDSPSNGPSDAPTSA